MYLRFVVADIDEDSERALGVFHAVRYLRDAGRLYPYEEDQHDIVRWWFDENLEKPTRFTASKPPFYRKKNKAISWFKHTALEHLATFRRKNALSDIGRATLRATDVVFCGDLARVHSRVRGEWTVSA